MIWTGRRGHWLVLAAALICAGCVDSGGPGSPAAGGPTRPESTKPFKFGLVTGQGGLGDRSFNDMQYNGMILARQRYGIEYEYATPASLDDFEPMMKGLIRKDCNVIIAGGGRDAVDPVDHLSVHYPRVTFVLLDDQAKVFRQNVVAVRYRQNEGAFLAGALAAMMTKSGQIGLIAAMDYPVIRDFMVGYAAGARSIRPDIRIAETFILSSDPKTLPWSNPGTARELALRMYREEGADVIFGVASASNLGIFRAAEETGRYAIGVDCDQDYQAPGFILASVVKRLDLSVGFIAGKLLDGSIENRQYVLGLKEDGIGLSPMEFTRDKIPSASLDRLEQIRRAIIAGTIRVPSVFPPGS